MTKQEQINKYLNENNDSPKEKLIKELSKKFNIAESSATTFYYVWKKVIVYLRKKRKLRNLSQKESKK
ncbi:hypothetical protein [Clostridium neonatale]|uniref:hypothetical protein n=1 Tax=Clostridium neonatale TaxID=137838 RepID=UPI00291B86C4|nr:hypothetical protein [Clostridium neonatale]CAI3193165.1 hypothetical protein CNEO2_130136 [Clostridium neonatale]CAI3196890.1 hypothetical protein CNEO2_160005 [Clostridium neonatale]